MADGGLPFAVTKPETINGLNMKNGENTQSTSDSGCSSQDSAIDSNHNSTSQSDSLYKIARSEFNKNRKIIIRNVPPVTYEEVKDFLGGCGVNNISISKKSRHAIVSLQCGEDAELLVSCHDGGKLLDTEVSVELYPNENLLCVAHLPFNMDDADFKSLVSEYGAIERCFLMRTVDDTSKGYGFVEFQHNKEKSNQARMCLDGRKVGTCVLHCEFLEPDVVSFEDLHSRCLFVDHLPPSFDNSTELKSTFSQVVEPQYFELAMQGGQPLGFAVVQYSAPEEAEETQNIVHGVDIRGHKIRVTYCIPGQEAAKVYERLISVLNVGLIKTGLLPNPANGEKADGTSPTQDTLTNPLVYSLLSQAPLLLQSFQFVLQQLQQAQQTQQPKPGLLGIAPNIPSNPLVNPNLQVALLAVLLAVQLQKAQPSLLCNPSLQQLLNGQVNGQNTNGRVANRPSLLGNPMIAQANSMLQSVYAQSSPQSQILQGIPNFNVNINLLNNIGQLIEVLGKPSSPSEGSSSPEPPKSASPDAAGMNNNKTGLLGDAPAKAGLLGDGPQAQGASKVGLLGDRPAGWNGEAESQPTPQPGVVDVGPANPLLATYLERQIKAHLSKLQPPQSVANNAGKTPLLPNPDHGQSNNGHILPSSSWKQRRLRDHHGHFSDIRNHVRNGEEGHSDSDSSTSSIASKTVTSVTPSVPNSTLSIHTANRIAILANKPADPQNTFFLAHKPNLAKIDRQPLKPVTLQSVRPQPQPIIKKHMLLNGLSGLGVSPAEMAARPQLLQPAYALCFDYQNQVLGSAAPFSSQHAPAQVTASSLDVSNYAMAAGGSAAAAAALGWDVNGLYAYQQLYQQYLPQPSLLGYQVMGMAMTGAPNPLLPTMAQALPAVSGSHPKPSDFAKPMLASSLVTPIGSRKRSRLHLLPSPEASPDGPYVGQHSQGIGGHYAETYIKKPRL